MKIEKNNNIVKHNDLITKTKYNLGENSLKILSVLISQISEEDVDFREYSININNFKENTNIITRNTYYFIHSIIAELLSKPLKIGDIQYNWIASGEYVKGKSIIKFTIHPKLKKYLLQLKKDYTTYRLEDILLLKGKYVIRIYELLKQHYNKEKYYNNKKKEIEYSVSIKELRERFNVPKSYKYSDIKNILKKTKEEIDEKTDIQIEFVEVKKGRKIEEIVFKITENKKGSNNPYTSLKSFIKYVRKNRVNQNLMVGIDGENPQKTVVVAVGEDGLLYDKKTLKTFNKQRSMKIWETLYKTESEKQK